MERRFRLQSILNYRTDLEEALQLELGRLLGEAHVAREGIAALRGRSERALVEAAERLAGPRPELAAVEQGFIYVDALAAQIEARETELAELSARVEAKRSEVVAAMQARKVLEKLKQRHDRAYAEWVRQAEQALADDMATVRHNRRVAEEVSGR